MGTRGQSADKMAHGNGSDMAFLLLLVGAIQTWMAPDLLMKVGDGSGITQFNALRAVSGGLALLLGMMLSGVKWNRANGKGGGVGAFCAVANSAVLAMRTGHIFYWVFAVPLLAGGLHILFFPSTPVPPRTAKTKNNHGNTSDTVALLLLASSMLCIFYPAAYFQSVGPVPASFVEGGVQAEAEALLSYCGGVLLTIALIFSGVKWNPNNGKMGGFGCFVCAGMCAYLGSGLFFYYHAAVLLLGGAHIFFFPSNP